MDKHVFVALIEVKPLVGCEFDPQEIAGAFVRCYVYCESEQTAMSRIGEALREDSFALVDTEWCVPDDETEWEKPDDPDGLQFVSDAKDTGEVIFSEFMCWGYDATDDD